MFSRFDYGKIVNGELVNPDGAYVENGNVTIGYDETFLIARGWKKIVMTIPPMDDLEHDPIYTETDVITITWT